MKSITTTVNGRRNGTCYEFFENGNIKRES